MKKSNSFAEVMSIVAAAVSICALAVAIIALLKSFSRDKLTACEYDYYDDSFERSDYGDIAEDDDIGSDTLAF